MIMIQRAIDLDMNVAPWQDDAEELIEYCNEDDQDDGYEL